MLEFKCMEEEDYTEEPFDREKYQVELVEYLCQTYRDKIKELEEHNKKLAEIGQYLLDKYQQVSERLQIELIQKFGRNIDWIDPAQLPLFHELVEEKAADESGTEEKIISIKSYVKRQRGRKPIADAIPREDHVIDIPEEEKTCACGCKLSKIGEEISEKVEIVPARIYAKRTIRLKYACRNCEGSGDEDKPAVRIAPVPPSIIPKGIATPSLLASVFIDKFADHLPFSRQQARYERMGIYLSRQNMCNWLQRVYKFLKPLFKLMKRHLITGNVIRMDETTFQVMNEAYRSDFQKSYMWLALGGPPDKQVCIYEYHETRGSRHIHGFIDGFKGFLQTDGYEGYGTALKDHPDITHAGCFAHARRKFAEAEKISEKKDSALEGIVFIKKLYNIEDTLRAQDLSDKEFLIRRKNKALPVLEKFRKWLEEKAEYVPPSLKLGKAIHYCLNQWTKLIAYLECAELTPDNNEAERKIKPFVIGRKNWMINGSPAGAEASCGMFSLVETAKANGLNPYDYLFYVFEEAPKCRTMADWEALLPWNIEINAAGKVKNAV